jgi:hypothetical protein
MIKYSYTDWDCGIIAPEDIYHYFKNGELGDTDFHRIRREQEFAFAKLLQDQLSMVKMLTVVMCDSSVLPEKQLEGIISMFEESVSDTGHQQSLMEALSGEEAFKLTKAEIDDIMITTVDWSTLPKHVDNFYKQFNWDVEAVNRELDPANPIENTPFTCIVRTKALEWLKWYKKQLSVKEDEPSFANLFEDFYQQGADKDTKNKNEPQMLIDIWLPDRSGQKKKYDEFIEFLKAPYPEIDTSFVSEINGQLHWNRTPKKGFASYLAGFIYVCVKNKWIKDDYSGEDYKRILGNTFNIEFNKKPFEQIAAKAFDDKYLKPFKNFPANI